MQSRLEFVAKLGALSFLAACADGSGLTNNRASLSSARTLTASWKLHTPNTSDWYIAVVGYSLGDVFNGRLPQTIDVRQFPELGPSPAGIAGKNVKFLKPCSTQVCPSPLIWENMKGSVDISSGTLPDGSLCVGNSAEFAGGSSSNTLLGVDYYGSNGSTWFAGANNLNFPVSTAQESSIIGAFYRDNTNTGC